MLPRPARLSCAAAAVATALTLAVVTIPDLRFAYRAPTLHVVLETANAVVALLVAFLLYGRYRQSARTQELLLTLGLLVVALANLALTALPSAVSAAVEDASHWGAVPVRLLGTLLLAVAALVPRTARAGRRQARSLTGAVAALVIGAGTLGVVRGEQLSPLVELSAPIGDATSPQLVAHPAVLAAQALGAVLYGVAAVALVRQARPAGGDDLLRWLAAGCVLAAAARVHYFLFPSIYSDYVYSGDALRLGFYLCLLVGAVREIESYWRLRADAAVLEDRRRLARELHDGLLQELAYIRAESSALPATVVARDRITSACDRALDEARTAVQALGRTADEPLGLVLHRAAEELSRRYQVDLEVDLDDAVDARPDQRHALVRIAREAVSNAVRHGRARRISVQLSNDPAGSRLAVRDDGTGFDVAAVTAGSGGYGLTSMRERARALPGSLEVRAAPGRGSVVTVRW